MLSVGECSWFFAAKSVTVVVNVVLFVLLTRDAVSKLVSEATTMGVSIKTFDKESIL
jgi:hypothetical protein